MVINNYYFQKYRGSFRVLDNSLKLKNHVESLTDLSDIFYIKYVKWSKNLCDLKYFPYLYTAHQTFYFLTAQHILIDFKFFFAINFFIHLNELNQMKIFLSITISP